MTGHALLSPSASKRWGSDDGCRASIQRSAGLPRVPNAASRGGTARHYVSGLALEQGKEPADFKDRKVVFVSEIDAPNDEREVFADQCDQNTAITNAEFEVDAQFVKDCAQYTGFVREQHAMFGGDLHIEVKVPIDHITKEAGATGTSDAVIFAPPEILVIDAKFGRGRVNAYEVVTPAVIGPDGEVAVPAVIEPNSQLAMYASGAIAKYDLFDEVKTVRLIIVQPAINHVSEFVLDVKALKQFTDKLAAAADETRAENPQYNPTSDNCFFCPARIDCHAREAAVLGAVLGDFDDLDSAQRKPIDEDNLGVLYEKLGMVREWVKDVEARMFMALDNNKIVRNGKGLRFKFVTGKRGNREWSDDAQVLALIKEMRIKDEFAFKKSLMSPTQMEALAAPRKSRNKDVPATKPPIGPIKWKRLAALITQAEGKAEIALETDPRPTRHTLENDFEEVKPEPVIPNGLDLFN